MSTPDLSTARWRKSSRSTGQGGQCVEIAGLPAMVAVRDSKDPDGAKLIFVAAEWQAFTGRVQAGRHDIA